ncbi:phosphonoacetaldehyde reductase [Marinomonas sp. M1K-6]|uniref:Phosphonoacetaldehyde reductase n=1 Tax=Marinomonas profundi TaxID=2726122 RepID=A0A847QZU5_9GAMM|nr:phosphonoacetaldehyde reductase [Marinomonas profundi]NLQ18979.1 phosphonoacetaldehyde reductase [Marinomonas profundi]UDV04189.1 phosphonoacetaldehyde reductase [Marinomonas profundi]
MKDWHYHNPATLIAGAGSLEKLPQLITPGRWLLVTSAGFTRRGLTEKIQYLLSDVQLIVHDQVTPNPELDDLEAIIQHYRSQKFQGIIAIGGGSVLDAAKVLAVALPSALQQPLTEVLRQGKKHVWQQKLPLVVIPTTSGTGAEVTPFATVWDQTQHKKYSVIGDQIFPEKVLLDPELTLGLPDQETLYTGLDAVSHALESLWNVNRSPVSSSFAIQALELAEKALPQVLNRPSDLKARTAMQNASVLAGLAISQTRTAIAHSISYPLTSHYGVPHGLACSFTLPRLIHNYVLMKPDSKEKHLLLRIKLMLEGMDLDNRLAKYVSNPQIESLKSEMFHPDRVGNYSGDMTMPLLNKIIFTI